MILPLHISTEAEAKVKQTWGCRDARRLLKQTWGWRDAWRLQASTRQLTTIYRTQHPFLTSTGSCMHAVHINTLGVYTWSYCVALASLELAQ